MLLMDNPKVALDQAVVKETISGIQVTELPQNFYKTMLEYINNSTDKTKLMAQLEALKAKRKAKIIQIAAGTIPIENIKNRLTDEDVELFASVRNALVKYDDRLTQ